MASDELLWNIFELSARSIYSDDLIRPFPSDYIDRNGIKDFSRLLENIKQRNRALFAFLTSSFPIIRQVTKDPIINRLLCKKKHARPDLVYKIDWPESKEKRFQSSSTENRRNWAFHGSKPENFYSILQHGLLNGLNKRSLFGEGTYLSTEIDVGLSFAPTQSVNLKNGDRLIQSLRCVCLCELSSDGVRTKNDRNGVPESYIVVTNDDSSIVRYLLVYIDKECLVRDKVFTIYSLLDKYGFFISVLLFLALILFISK